MLGSGIKPKIRNLGRSKARAAKTIEAIKAELAECTTECERLKDELKAKSATLLEIGEPGIIPALNALLNARGTLTVEHVRASHVEPHEVRELANELNAIVAEMSRPE